MNYWQKRQQQLNKQLEKDEAKLKKRLSSYFDTGYRKLDKQIAAYYKQYGMDNVIQYRRLMESLSEDDKRLLMEQMDEFAKKYPEYAHLMPVRESIYKLNRLEGLQYSVRMQQLEIGAVENEQLTAHLNRNAERGVNAAAEAMGFGKNFYANNPDISKLFINVPWSNGENFSQKIWNNTTKLANYLNSDIAQGIARGDSYERLTRRLRERFSSVSRNDAYRLIYTEGTYVMAEATMQPFTEDFEKYRLSTVGDAKVCSICRGVAREVFNISDRQPGVNFPPLHPWCRCAFTIEVDDWDAWMADYEAKHSGDKKQAEKIANHMTSNKNNANNRTDLDRLNKQFEDLTDGYSYDDFIKDFGSIEDGFEGADEKELIKAKMLADKIERLKKDLNIPSGRTREEAVAILNNIGIKLKNYTSEELSDEIYSKYADFIVNFENNHPAYFNNNKLQLKSISIVDDIRERGQLAAGIYYPDTQSIRINRKDIGKNLNSKLVTYSKSDDYDIHFLAHEYAHYIADSLEKNLSIYDYDIIQNSLLKHFDGDIFKAKTSNLVDDLSSYGSLNAKEAFAEAFAEAYTSEKPRKFASIFKEELEKVLSSGIANTTSSGIMKLPRYKEAVIPKAKFTQYALNPDKDPDKARAFKSALGYDLGNADDLIGQINAKLPEYEAVPKGDRGWGMTYEVVMDITGPNGEQAKVLTAWIDDKHNGEMRLTTVHVDD